MNGRPLLRASILFAGGRRLLDVLGEEIAKQFTRRTVAAMAAASLTIGLLGLAMPLTLVQVYDRIVAYRSSSTLVWLFGACALALCLETLVTALRGRMSAWSAARLASAYEVRAVDTLLSAESESVAETEPGEQLERLGAGRSAAALVSQAIPALADIPFFLLYISTLTFIGGYLVLVPLASLALQFAFSLYEVPRAARERLGLIAVERERVDEISRALGNVSSVKAQAIEPFLAARFERTQMRQADAAYSVMRRERISSEFQRLVTAFTTFAVIALGAGAVARGRLTVGSLSTMLLLSSRAIGSAQGLVRIVYRRADARIATELAAQALGLGGRAQSGPPLPSAVDGRLEFAGVSSRPDSPAGFRDANFILRPGDSLGLGPDGGAWRGSLCLVAAGHRKPDAGEVLLDIYPLDRWDATSGGVVAYVPPRGELLPGTVVENLTGFCPALRESALDAAGILGLDGPVARLPRGYDTVLDPRMEILPSSLVQRLCVARSIARRPKLLVWNRADEGLDNDGRLAALELLRRLSGETTMVISSSSPELLGLCRCRAELESGQVVVKEAAR